MRRASRAHPMVGLCPTLVFVAALGLAASPARAERPNYPESPVHPVADTLHGVVLTDNYRWLEDDNSPEVRKWTDQQNAFTAKALGAYPGRAELRAKLEKLYSIPAMGTPVVQAGRYFQPRRDGLQNHAVLYLSDGAFGGPRRPVLDPNTFSKDGTTALDWWYLSPDASLMAYGKSSSGDEQSTLYVRDVAAGKDLSEAIPRTRGASGSASPGRRAQPAAN